MPREICCKHGGHAQGRPTGDHRRAPSAEGTSLFQHRGRTRIQAAKKTPERTDRQVNPLQKQNDPKTQTWECEISQSSPRTKMQAWVQAANAWYRVLSP